jgi:hypothetical protein
MFKKMLLLFFVFIICILLYFHIANSTRRINIKHPRVVYEPDFELQFEKVPIGVKTIFGYPDIMRNVKITKLSMYYTVWKYSMVLSNVNKMRKSIIGIVDYNGKQLPPFIYHASIILEESDDSEFVYIIEFCYDVGLCIYRVLRNTRLCNNSTLNYIKPFLDKKEEETFLMIQPVKLNSPSILELISVMLYRMSNGDNEKIIDKIHHYHIFKFNCQIFISEAIISIIDYIEDSDKERVLNTCTNCIQDAPIALKSFLGWKEYIFSNTFFLIQLDKIVKYMNF